MTVIKQFGVKLQLENSYYRLCVTHPTFKGRIRKRIGYKTNHDLNGLQYTIKYELENHFRNVVIDKDKVESFLERFISMNIKCTASIFDYKTEFLRTKADTTNKHTKKKLSYCTLSGYRTALNYFEQYLTESHINPHPSQITNVVLDNFYHYIDGNHNYKVKLHTKLKGFIIFLDKSKRLSIDPSYKASSFTEIYDNQCPEDDDIALSEEDVKKLIDLRNRFLRNEIVLELNIKNQKIPAEVQKSQFNMKLENIKKCLDCYLFMISTGMYYADIRKSELYLSTQGQTTSMQYRRAKNGSLCKGIPIRNDGFLIAAEIIKQYRIKNATNFPIKLSATHFAKHLERIGILAGLDFKLKNKMARKTFASIFYFKRNLPIHYLMMLLGHNDVADTQHYLRIRNKDIVDEILRWMPAEIA